MRVNAFDLFLERQKSKLNKVRNIWQYGVSTYLSIKNVQIGMQGMASPVIGESQEKCFNSIHSIQIVHKA